MYAGNNPTNGVDPTGFLSFGRIVGGAIGSVVGRVLTAAIPGGPIIGAGAGAGAGGRLGGIEGDVVGKTITGDPNDTNGVAACEEGAFSGEATLGAEALGVAIIGS